MAKYLFHLIYDNYSDIDQTGYVFASPFKATNEALLLLITVALEAQVFGKPVPRQVAIVECGNVPKIIAIRDAT